MINQVQLYKFSRELMQVMISDPHNKGDGHGARFHRLLDRLLPHTGGQGAGHAAADHALLPGQFLGVLP